MKIRADFVTNSSSSSYVSLEINSPLLAQILEDYKNVLKDRGELPAEGCGGYLSLPIDVNKGTISSEQEECPGCFESVPGSIEAAYSTFCRDLVEVNSNNLSEEARARIAPLMAVLAQKQDEIVDSIESLSWHYTDQGWGGDHEGRFNPQFYPEECIDAIWKQIAEARGCTVDELSGDDWSDYVADLTSHEEVSFRYNKATGECKFSHDFYVE